jgi:hypothetical protein
MTKRLVGAFLSLCGLWTVVGVTSGASGATPQSYPLGKAPACVAGYVRQEKTHLVRVRVKRHGRFHVEHRRERYAVCVLVENPSTIPTSGTTTFTAVTAPMQINQSTTTLAPTTTTVSPLIPTTTSLTLTETYAGGPVFDVFTSLKITAQNGQSLPVAGIRLVVVDETTDKTVAIDTQSDDTMQWPTIICTGQIGTDQAQIFLDEVETPWIDTYSVTAIYPGSPGYAPSTSAPVAMSDPMTMAAC